MTATRTPDPSPAATYRLGTGTSAGIWLGLGTGRVALLGAGLVASILTLTTGAPAVLAFLPLLAGLAFAAVRVAGRPLTGWLAPAAAHQTATFTGTGRWTGSFPSIPTSRPGRQPGRESVRLRLPAEYGRLRLADCPDDPRIGLLTDAATRTVTVVFDVAGVDRFPLLEPADQDGLIAGWGQTLAILADTDSALMRLQLLERAGHASAPDHLDSAADGDGLAGTIEGLATWHECRLAAQWALPRLDTVELAGIGGRCQTISRALLAARLATRPLPAADLAADLASAFRGQPAPQGWAGRPGPLSRSSSWTRVTTDDTCHRCFAVTGWPQVPVGADWLAPLLLAAPVAVTRTVAIHLQRVSVPAAARVARTARAKAALDQRDRQRLGMTASAAIDRAESSGVLMDEELAAGYRTHRLTAVLALTAPSPGLLDDAGPALRAAAAACRLELQPLHGQHDRALAATLPLCRLRPRGQA